MPGQHAFTHNNYGPQPPPAALKNFDNAGEGARAPHFYFFRLTRCNSR